MTWIWKLLGVARLYRLNYSWNYCALKQGFQLNLTVFRKPDQLPQKSNISTRSNSRLPHETLWNSGKDVGKRFINSWMFLYFNSKVLQVLRASFKNHLLVSRELEIVLPHAPIWPKQKRTKRVWANLIKAIYLHFTPLVH